MEKKLVELLWAKYLDGSALEKQELQELIASLQNDPELKSNFLSDLSLHGVLKEMGRDQAKDHGSLSSILTCIEAEKDGDAFVMAFQSRLREEQSREEEKQAVVYRQGSRHRTILPIAFGISAAVAILLILPSILPYFPVNHGDGTQVSTATGISKPPLAVNFVPKELKLTGTAPPGILSVKLGDVEASLADGTWKAKVPFPSDGKIPLLALYSNGHVERKVISVSR